MIEITNNILYSNIIKVKVNGNSNNIVKIFPNPVSYYAQIAVFSQVDSKVQVSVYDETGRLIQTISTVLHNGNSIIKLSDFSAWANGIYTLKINLGNELYIKRMVLNK